MKTVLLVVVGMIYVISAVIVAWGIKNAPSIDDPDEEEVSNG